MFYSASTGGFYSREIHGTNMPADVVEITAEEHAALINGQSFGKIIVADAAGRPVIQDPPPPTDEQLASMERVWRNGELDRADIELNKVKDGMGFGSVTDWLAYRCALRNWPENAAFPDSAQRPVAPDIVVIE